MRRRRVQRLYAVEAARGRSFLSPIVIGLALWAGFPTPAAYQDMASYVSGIEQPTARWGAVVEAAAAGSVHQAELAFSNGDAPGGAGMRAGDLGTVAFRDKNAGNATPDEDRITRTEKGARIVKVQKVAPPKAFNAGSVFDRTSSLLRSTLDGDPAMAFAVPDIRGKEIEIAAAFHERHEKKLDPAVPAMLASLVNNDKPDILATAYAPATPDWAKTSPFEVLLRQSDPNEGRFIPPSAPGDHPWVKTPLPASVFSKQEQQCLTAGIYFEARGEAVAGQAAVAQVILNRVRNPTYPKSICGVVYQNESWRNRCQFSFACDGIKDRIASPAHWKTAEDVAMAVTAGKIWIPEVGSSTHYHATYVHPRWANTMEKMKKIGQHIFYRTYGGGWS